MRIDHVFYRFNPFGGAEEHVTSLAVLQTSQGEDASVCLIQAASADNQYVLRLKAAGVPVCQWPVWLSRLSGDWDTREAILRRWTHLLSPVITLASFPLASVSGRPRKVARSSVEGRARSSLGRFLDPAREKQMFLLLLDRRYRQRKPDVLHLHSYGADFGYVLQWAHAHNVATVYQEHSTPDLTARRSYALPASINAASIVVAVSQASARALQDVCAVNRPIEVIPPIVTLSVPQKSLRPTHSHSGSRVRIITIARLSEEKGLTHLIEAAGCVVAVAPNTSFVIYGEGPLRESLQAQIDASNLHHHVTLAGRFTHGQLTEIMSSADMFVLPSMTEGFPLVIVEAMAWGLPIVATAVGGIPELLQDGITALLCPPGDSKALARAILTLIEHPAQSEALGMTAKSAYQQGEFRPEHVLARFTTTYAKAMAMHSPTTIHRLV